MPDRDMIPNLPHREWAPACSLLARQDDVALTGRAAESALAKSLRRDPPRVSSRDEFERDVEQRLRRGLLGPALAATLQAAGITETSRRANTLIAEMRPAFSHFYDQVSNGKTPRARPVRKLSVEETLRIRVATTLTTGRTES